MNEPNCPLCGVEMKAIQDRFMCFMPCSLQGGYTAKEIARLANPNPWRPIAEVPRDGRKIELWNGMLISPLNAEPDRYYTETHWRNHTPPPPPKEPWEEAWTKCEWVTTDREALELAKAAFRHAFDLGRQSAKEGK